MKIKFDAYHLTILAALGLACASRPGTLDEDGGSSGSEDDSSSASSSAESGSAEGDGDTGDGDTGDGDGDPPPPYGCEDPQPIMQAGTDVPSGFVSCTDGFVHRVEQVECVDPQGADAEACAMDEFGACQTAADCVDQDHGRCVMEPLAGCQCSYGCATDADCNEGFICACAGVAGTHSTCIPADCTLDADCGEGLCGLSVYEGCCGTSYELACADPDEACHVNAECEDMPCNPDFPDGQIVEWQCSVQEEFAEQTGEWTCKPPGWCNCDCGRPFFVAGEARVAPVLARSDWSLAVAPALASLDADTRRRLAAHWAQIGRFEHASVASFARFALQLLQLGAPPSLVRDTQRALADEIEHARLAFGLASAYAGAPVGPGPLEVGAALEAGLDLRAIVEGLIVEACVGETLAALEAREAALQAEDPAVAGVLEQIAADEWRHAQLGWRSLAWLLGRGDATLREFAVATLDAAIAAVRGSASEGMPVGLRAQGVLDDRLRDELRVAALSSVIAPCVDALREQGVGARVS
jgi:hypothetical protein